MSDQKKSVLLAKAMGWEEVELQFVDDICKTAGWLMGGECCEQTNLYDPANMALAWRVHVWACNHQFGTDTWPYLSWFDAEKIFEYEDAQRRWLDKIFSMLIK